MRVQLLSPGQVHTGVLPGPARVDPVGGLGPRRAGELLASYDGWRPRVILGADSAGGLLLPAAQPTAAQLYAPRAVWTDGTLVVVADTGNHRVLIWDRLPEVDHAAAAVVLGQPDACSEGAAAGGAANGMRLPTGVLVDQGRLVVADAWHHRLLVWDQVPTRTGTAPDRVIGQPTSTDVEPNAGSADGRPSASSFYWPFGIAMIDGRFYVADTGNRRVLGWRGGLPEPGQPADLVLGQPDPQSREENRGAAAAADSFRWPHAIAGTGSGGVLIADAGNHRVLRFDAHPEMDRGADAVLGQDDFAGSAEFPYVAQTGRLRFPYAVATPTPSPTPSPTLEPTDPTAGLAVADTANNRVLIYASTQAAGRTAPLVALAQPTLSANGENRWSAVDPDSLCWPYGLHWHRTPRGTDLLAIADSGNNRIVIWEKP